MRHRTRLTAILLAGAAALTGAAQASAQERPVLLRDSFPIGSGDGVLCQVQDRSAENPLRTSAFDRAWAVVCRDSARPVANIYMFQDYFADPWSRIAPHRGLDLDCSRAPIGPKAGIPGAIGATCTVAGSGLEWSSFGKTANGKYFVADGFAAYDDATRLALLSVIENKVAEGRIDAASVSVNDPLAFARVQAESLKPEQALIEGYRRNLGGEYAEAAAYFQTLQERVERERDTTIEPSEFVLNRALQQSNLGDFAEAEKLFDIARPLSQGQAVGERLQRNFEAIHLLNRRRSGEALARIAQPLSAGLDSVGRDGDAITITVPLAARLNSGDAGSLIALANTERLTPTERAEIIDAQAQQIRGTALRLEGQPLQAREVLLDANRRALAVRDGRVVTIVRLRSQIAGDLGAIAEGQGDLAAAERYLRDGLALVETQYPERRAVSGAQARLASFLLRNGREEESLAIYEALVDRSAATGGGTIGFSGQLVPYFRHLARNSQADPAAASRFFTAAQLLVRPGAAETQAVLARELSAGSDEASSLFRQSTDLARSIEQARIRVLALRRGEQGTESERRIAELDSRIAQLEAAQAQTLASLAQFPQYRAVSPRTITLEGFQQALAPGEAYARLAMAGPDMFMLWVTPDNARVWRIGMAGEDLDFYVDMLRASISIQEAGQYVTYPFDIDNSRELFGQLFGPASGDLAQVDHLIFEPDGAMLRLPIDLLVTDDASVERYRSQEEADAYDFRGVNWLGRNRRISVALSAQGFVDARNAPSSTASREYLGLGNNSTPEEVAPAQGMNVFAAAGSDSCGWQAANWRNPIDPSELFTAREIVGEDSSQVVTKAGFTDTAIKENDDLDEYRILHFATHGLVTPPRPECPVIPSLLTSFGGAGSDGLLGFDEIFDLSLDADLVILSACDTAGGASVEATRAAGLSSGGGTALDGLVRSFVGAGGRTVLASHWPAPDDYRATERLMSDLFRASPGESIGAALKRSQLSLMDDAETSHPYYWSGFALIGDGEKALLGTAKTAAQSTENAGEGE